MPENGTHARKSENKRSGMRPKLVRMGRMTGRIEIERQEGVKL
jgi:hypothetical protein